jgi:hypothetical protein
LASKGIAFSIKSPMKKHVDSPHMRAALAGSLDFNGVLRWSVASVQERYLRYCRSFAIEESRTPQPREHVEGERRWLFPIMESVIEGIRRGDRACAEIGIEFVEEDEHFVFGRLLKSDAARALRRADLNEVQKSRLRTRIVTMLLDGYVPHEFQQYAKLLRHIGLGSWWPTIEKNINRSNPYVVRYYEYLRDDAGRR